MIGNSTLTRNSRLEAKESDRKDFIHYILKQSEHYDLSQDEVIVNAALFMYVPSIIRRNSFSVTNAKAVSQEVRLLQARLHLL